MGRSEDKTHIYARTARTRRDATSSNSPLWSEDTSYARLLHLLILHLWQSSLDPFTLLSSPSYSLLSLSFISSLF